MSLETQLARRFLRSKKGGRFLSAASFVAIVGMAFGVAALFIALSVISGFQKEYKRAILGVNSHLIFMNAEEIQDPGQLASRLTAFEPLGHMLGWTSFIYREGMAVSDTRVKGIVIKGIDFASYGKLSKLKITEMFSETLPPEAQDLPKIFLGKTLASELMPKDRILRVLFPKAAKSIQKFFVAGTFESGLYEYDSNFVFLDLPEAKAFFGTQGRVSGIEVWLEDPDRAEAWAEALRKESEFDYPYQILTWRELNENVFRALEMEKVVFFLLMVVLIAVASLNILGSLLMLILSRRTEVAILAVMGLSEKRLRKIFLFDGLLIGSAGITIGILLGLAVLSILRFWHPVKLAAEVYFVNQVPVDFSWSNFFWVISSALLVVWIGCRLGLRGLSKVSVIQTLSES